MSIRWILLLTVALWPQLAQSALVTHFNFNTYDGDAATIDADSGGGVITLESGGTDWPAAELSNPTGTTVNAVGADPAGTALSLGNDGNQAIVRTLTIELSTLGFANLMLSMATAGSNSTFNDADISYSLNGSDYIDTGLSFDPAVSGSFGTITQDLSGISALDDQASVFIRLTLSGAQLNQNQDLLIDNLQINGAAVPEASSWAMMMTAAFCLALCGWRSRRGSAVTDSTLHDPTA